MSQESQFHNLNSVLIYKYVEDQFNATISLKHHHMVEKKRENGRDEGRGKKGVEKGGRVKETRTLKKWPLAADMHMFKPEMTS